jgi:hypothetical protein
MNEPKVNAFIGRAEAPGDAELDLALGKRRSLWDEVLKKLGEEFGLTSWEWNSYSPKYGWSVRVKKGKRNIVYLTPCEGQYVQIAFILGAKAVESVRGSGVARAVKLIEDGVKYPEGLGVRWDLGARDWPVIRTMTAGKMIQ